MPRGNRALGEVILVMTMGLITSDFAAMKLARWAFPVRHRITSARVEQEDTAQDLRSEYEALFDDELGQAQLFPRASKNRKVLLLKPQIGKRPVQKQTDCLLPKAA